MAEPIDESALEGASRRLGWRRSEASAQAERLVDGAVADALVGTPRFDLLPPELEPVARQRFEERLRAGEGHPGSQRAIASTGARQS